MAGLLYIQLFSLKVLVFLSLSLSLIKTECLLATDHQIGKRVRQFTEVYTDTHGQALTFPNNMHVYTNAYPWNDMHSLLSTDTCTPTYEHTKYDHIIHSLIYTDKYVSRFCAHTYTDRAHDNAEILILQLKTGMNKNIMISNDEYKNLYM